MPKLSAKAARERFQSLTPGTPAHNKAFADWKEAARKPEPVEEPVEEVAAAEETKPRRARKAT